MKPQVKEAWLKALRSGEYQQGKRALRINNEYCCLGVLCDVYDKQSGNTETLWRGWEGKSEKQASKLTFYSYFEEQSVLSEEVRAWAGLNDASPHVYVKEDNGGIDCITLTVLNDEGNDFNQIADVIEKHF